VNIHDYLIDLEGKDWGELLEDFSPPLPAEFTLWMVNRFGDAFVVLDDGAVHMLDVGVGSLKRLADDREHFAELADIDDNAMDWLMIPLVNDCVDAGMALAPGQCYGFKIPPIIGGEYEVVNIEPRGLAAHYSYLSQFHQQTKDLPDGTRVRIIFGRRPG
jgi:hypothetical protein